MGEWSGGVRNFQSCEQLEREFMVAHYFDGAPAQAELERRLSDWLGRPTVCCSQGMAAVESVILTLTDADSVVACSEDVYPGTRRTLSQLKESKRLKGVVWFDPSDIHQFERMLKRNSISLLFIETIGNAKQMRVADWAKMAALCDGRSIWLVIDSTFTPALKVDLPDVILVTSMTKYDQDGDDLMGGRISADEAVIRQIRNSRFFQNRRMSGGVAEGYLAEGDPANIEERYFFHSQGALALAEIANNHPAVEAVWYPGLKTHPGHEVVSRLYAAQAGGVLYLQLKGGEEAACKLSDKLADDSYNEWVIAVSFGGFKWRVLPWIGFLRQYCDCDGLLRIASGRAKPDINLGAFKCALDKLV